MAEFVSSFITGFQDVVAEDLPEKIKGLKILNLFDGLVHYSFSGDSRELEKVIYFNNTFFVLKTMKGKGLNFPSMVGAVASEKKYYLINKGTFRVRFQNENQFAKVDKNISKKAEETVIRNSKLQIDRLSPATEIWYSIRREGFAFCGQLISKREFTEKNLHKGELRPEIAYLISSFARINPNEVVIDPFCGYGSIPVQISKHFKCKKLYVSDLDSEKMPILSDKKQLKAEFVDLSIQNALELKNIEDKSINIVITDPPWGYFEDLPDPVQFYSDMFACFKRILVEGENSRMIVLSARKEEIEKAADQLSIKIDRSLHTLVNGKKASLYCFKF